MLQRSLKKIVVLFCILPLFTRAQTFRHSKTIQQIITHNNYEQKNWIYRFSPQYVKPATLQTFSFNYSFSQRSLRSVEQINSINNKQTENVIFPNRGTKYSQSVPMNYNSLQNFYVQSIGFFCKQEIKLEKNTLVPLRLRLGSVDYTNYMEQKPNANLTH